MKVLGLDPGTSHGWALLDTAGGIVHSGVWDLRPRRFEGGGMRFLRLRNLLALTLRGDHKPDLMAFEEVRRHLGVDAAHIYGGCIATIQSFAEEHAIPYCGVPVGTIKKRATGKGNADKVAMLEAARCRWPDAVIADDNEADARWIAVVAAEEFAESGGRTT